MPDLSDLNAVANNQEWSARWEDDFGTRHDTADTVQRVVELAEGRAVLEWGVGTGRLALPLAERGLHVHGVDTSPWMLEGLRAKPGGDKLPVTLGELVTTRVEGSFGVVLLASYTMLALTTQELQIACFQNAAAHLTSGGLFVVEVLSPHQIEKEVCSAITIGPEEVMLLVSTPDAQVPQTARTAHVFLRHGEPVRIMPWGSRCPSPAEMDLMARLAGMRLRDRWNGWDRQPYTPRDWRHVSVYEVA